MAAMKGRMDCRLYRSAFSGELVFRVETAAGPPYEGVTPRRYATPADTDSDKGTSGRVDVRVLSKGKGETRVAGPDGEILTVPTEAVHPVNS